MGGGEKFCLPLLSLCRVKADAAVDDVDAAVAMLTLVAAALWPGSLKTTLGVTFILSAPRYVTACRPVLVVAQTSQALEGHHSVHRLLSRYITTCGTACPAPMTGLGQYRAACAVVKKS